MGRNGGDCANERLALDRRVARETGFENGKQEIASEICRQQVSPDAGS
jgi:hypothetical protein